MRGAGRCSSPSGTATHNPDTDNHTYNATTTATKQCTAWIINDHQGHRRNALEQMLTHGTCHSIQHKNMSQTTAQDVLSQLKSTRPAILWICVPGNETGLDAKAQHRLKQLAMWTHSQLERQGAIFIEVPNVSIARALRDTVAALPRVTNLKWCNLGVTRPQSKRPIGSRATIMHKLDITELHN